MTLISSDFFILRTSRCSEDDYFKLYNSFKHNSALINDELAAIIKVSSGTLFSSMQREFKKGCQLSAKTEASALRTILRASFRSTPYGLSSTSSCGAISDTDEFVITPGDAILGNIVPGGEIIISIIRHINEINIRNSTAFLIINPTNYMVANRIRFICADSSLSGKYQYCEKNLTDIDQALIKFLRKRHRVRDVNEYLATICVSPSEYIEHALSSGFLVPELALPIHNRNGVEFITRYLQTNHPELEHEIRTLSSLRMGLSDIKGVSLPDVETIYSAIEAVMVNIGLDRRDEIKSPVLVDAVRKMDTCSLSRSTTKRLLKSVHTLMQRTARPTLLHERLARKISERFGDETIPIGFLADPKYGIALDPGSLAHFPSAEIYEDYERRLSAYLVDAIARSGCAPINLAEFDQAADVEAIFPNGAVLAQIRCELGVFGFSISSISGPEGLELFSRASLVDAHTGKCAKALSKRPAFEYDERVELAHIPSARGWHATMRPDHWSRSIAFPGVYIDGPALSCDDVFARVENGLVVMRDRSGRRLLPRVSSSHDMLNAENLPLYRALAIIGVPYAVGFHWPPIFANAKQLPRVMLDDVWLTPAQWRLTDQEREEAFSNGGSPRAFRAILQNRGISGPIEAGRDDKFLPVLDYDDDAMSAILPVLKAKDTIFRERFVTATTSIFQGGETNCGEIVLPFRWSKKSDKTADRHFNLRNYSFQATSPHLGQWISFKIYGPRSDMDRNVLHGLAKLSERMKSENCVEHWFFLRYGDPEFHLRFRIKVTELQYRSDVASILGEYLDQIAAKCLIDRWELATYRPETMRYGGNVTLPICEAIFSADSKVCWMLNSANENTEELSLVRHFVNASILLERLELMGQVTSHANETLSTWQETYRGIIGDPDAARAEANKAINENRALLQIRLSDLLPQEAGMAYSSSQALIAQVREEVEEGRTTIDGQSLLDSFFHMFSNRLYSDWSRRHEFVALCIAKRLLNFKAHSAVP